MCAEAEAINSESEGFPDLPIIGAEAKERAAAGGWNDVEMGVISARGCPEGERRLANVNICKLKREPVRSRADEQTHAGGCLGVSGAQPHHFYTTSKAS